MKATEEGRKQPGRTGAKAQKPPPKAISPVPESPADLGHFLFLNGQRFSDKLLTGTKQIGTRQAEFLASLDNEAAPDKINEKEITLMTAV